MCFELVNDYEEAFLGVTRKFCRTDKNAKGESVLTCEPAPLVEHLCLGELKICRPQVAARVCQTSWFLSYTQLTTFSAHGLVCCLPAQGAVSPASFFHPSTCISMSANIDPAFLLQDFPSDDDDEQDETEQADLKQETASKGPKDVSSKGEPRGSAQQQQQPSGPPAPPSSRRSVAAESQEAEEVETESGLIIEGEFDDSVDGEAAGGEQDGNAGAGSAAVVDDDDDDDDNFADWSDVEGGEAQDLPPTLVLPGER